MIENNIEELNWQELFPNSVKWQAHEEAIDTFLQVRCIDKRIHEQCHRLCPMSPRSIQTRFSCTWPCPFDLIYFGHVLVRMLQAMGHLIPEATLHRFNFTSIQRDLNIAILFLPSDVVTCSSLLSIQHGTRLRRFFGM